MSSWHGWMTEKKGQNHMLLFIHLAVTVVAGQKKKKKKKKKKKESLLDNLPMKKQNKPSRPCSHNFWWWQSKTVNLRPSSSVFRSSSSCGNHRSSPRRFRLPRPGYPGDRYMINDWATIHILVGGGLKGFSICPQVRLPHLTRWFAQPADFPWKIANVAKKVN